MQVGIQKPLGLVHKELWPDVLLLFCVLQDTNAVRGKRAVWVEVSLAQTDAIVLEVMFTLNENHLLWNTSILYLPSIQPLNEMF